MRAEDILATLAGRGQWLNVGELMPGDIAYRSYAKTMRELEAEIEELRGNLNAADAKALRSQRRREVALETVKGKQSRSRTTKGGAQEVIAEAVAGMPELQMKTLLWTVAGDLDSYSILRDRLLKRARKSFERDRWWPNAIKRGRGPMGHMYAPDYVPDLVHLALFELRVPHAVSTGADKARWFGVTREYWSRHMAMPYAVLQGATFEWFGTACGHILRRLRRAQQTA